MASECPSSLLLRESAEGCINLLTKLRVQDLLKMLVSLPWEFELHGCDLGDEILHGVVDAVPANLVLARALGNSLLGTVMEGHDNLHHAHGLAQRAEEIIVREAVLLQEVFTDDLGDLQGALLVLGQGVLADKLHNFLQVILLLQNFLDTLLQHAVLGVVLLEVWLQDARVLRERDVPVDRREVLSLGQLLVQTPEHLHDAQCRRGHGVCEVATGRGDRSDNGNRAFT
mmetsp:Transcript_2118/g.5368  ORF Transcript_2118/g.5368 Transcript_2118/m.5368 type:complete len:228 (-) Transcript_2118:1258-1941(-)